MPDAVLPEETPKRFFVELTDHLNTRQVQYLFAFEAGEENDRLKDYVRFGPWPDWLTKEE